MSVRAHHRGTFLVALAVATILVAILFHISGSRELRDLPAKPKFFLFDRGAYISGNLSASIDHFLFAYGLFGWDRKIRSSDIILLGTSHMEFGISAELLSAILEKELGRPYRVLNLARGYADGVAFSKEIFERRRLSDKIVVTDMFDPFSGKLSSFATENVAGINKVRAYYSVINYSLGPILEYVKDAVGLPQVRYENGAAVVSRALPFVSARDSSSGDVRYLWGTRGNVFAMSNPVPEPLPPERKTPLWAPGAARIYLDADWCQRRHLLCLYTLVPWPAASSDQAEALAASRRLPYLPISSEGLTYWDADHLDVAGRAAATRRLAEQLIPVLRTNPR